MPLISFPILFSSTNFFLFYFQLITSLKIYFYKIFSVSCGILVNFTSPSLISESSINPLLLLHQHLILKLLIIFSCSLRVKLFVY